MSNTYAALSRITDELGEVVEGLDELNAGLDRIETLVDVLVERHTNYRYTTDNFKTVTKYFNGRLV